MTEEETPPSQPGNILTSTLYKIQQDTVLRITTIASRLWPVALLSRIPSVSAQGQTPNNNAFVAQPSNDSHVLSDVISMMTPFDFAAWKHRGGQIRSGVNRAQCFGNLSLALSDVGALYSAEANGASGALSLLPTAGALIGAPAKELWVLYKLVPIAGVLSMLLSLGGNIVPTSASDYETQLDQFSYQGMIGTMDKGSVSYEEDGDEELPPNEKFSRQVQRRAMDTRGGKTWTVVMVGITSQLFWLAVILVACYLTQCGGIVAWWCKAWGWMYLWYLMVALSSLLENFAGVPFTKQWTLRVSKAPTSIKISPDAPLIVPCGDNNNDSSDPASLLTYAHSPKRSTSSIELHETRPKHDAAQQQQQPPPPPPALSRQQSDFLAVLSHSGINTTGQVCMDPSEPWAASRTSFYVVVSVVGVSNAHATLRVISKAISVGVFAAGTATFASATLITISVALTVLCLVLGAGVFGRVASMWMIARVMKERPILHRVVKSEADAARQVRSILGIPGLTFELLGHVIVNGRCVARYSKWWRWGTVFGILATPFRVNRLATTRGQQV
ncbi:hypothetical protein AOQ84DRAFT_390574 [Glonium stellatum]|uniref:Uncharacterized protein n=1 Tax=Glonium stellatum TaxID=574774 RepID=A0A8E2EVV6_9PEZI|nr:hypothetical protein AOQ84DRAFT_390574 [Glonium stellatum]